VASKKTMRAAVVTALSASLMMVGATAFAHENETPQSCQWPGEGQGKGAPSGHAPGNGYSNGWHHRKCKNHDDNSGGNPGGNPTGNPGGNPSGNPGGGTNDDDGDIDVNVTVEVDLPDIPLPDPTTAVESALDHASSAVYQTVTLAESDVAGLMAIVQAAGDGATSLVNGDAQAGASVSGTSASGALDVNTGGAGATSLGSDLAGSTLNLVNGNITGGWSILGTMSSML
jgi:hypothetical protein